MDVTQTSSVTINSAFLQEIKDVNQQLWDLIDEVRQLCKSELRNQWDCYRLCSRFELLRDQLATHFSLEEAYGYFDDPVSVAPRLSERVERLRQEHCTLYFRLAELVEFVQRLNQRRRLRYGISRVDLEFGGFYQDLLRHEDDECCLILEAYDDDVGVGD